MISALVAFTAFTGFLFGSEALVLHGFFSNTSLPAVLLLLILSVALPCLRPSEGIMILLTATTAGGVTFRRLVLPIFLVPIVVNWLELEGERHLHLHASFHWMFDTAMTVLMLGSVAWTVSNLVHKKELAKHLAETQLQESRDRERLLAQAVESADDLVSLTTCDDRFVYVNRAFERTYGYSLEELVGQSPEMLKPEIADPTKSHRAIRTSTLAHGWKGTLINRRKDGSALLVRLKTSPVKDSSGKTIALLGVARDITEEKRLADLQQRDSQILARLNDAVIGTDLQGNVIYWNLAATRLMGWSAGETMGRSFLAYHPENERTQRWERFQRVLQGETLVGERQATRKDGRPVWVHSHISLYHDERGDPIGVISVARDIDEQKHAESISQAKEARFRATFEQAGLGITLVDLDGRFMRANTKFCEIVDYTEAELTSRTFREITHPDDLARDLEHVRKLLAGGTTSYTLEKRYLRKGGEPVWVELTTSLVRRPDHAPDYFIAMISDITSRRALETELRQTQKMEAIGQLAGGVAHDFNNMLMAIQGHVSLIDLETNLPREARESLVEIMDATNRAANLTRQLLLFSRGKAFDPAQLDLNVSIRNATKILTRLIGERVSIKPLLWPQPLPIYADPSMIDQVLINLAVNARDAMPQGGTLLIATVEEDFPHSANQGDQQMISERCACLVVTDTGTGMPPEVLAKIFDPFFTTKEEGKGTGLGLATVHSVVTQHEGKIVVESEPGKGTTFRVFLPLCVKAVPIVPLPATFPEACKGQGESILIVEDDANVRMVIANTLARHGYHVKTAADADIAVRIWKESTKKIDLLIVDMVMPGQLTGWQLADDLTTRDPSLRVIYMSGYDPSKSEPDMGFTAKGIFLHKPFQMDELLGSIRRLVVG